MSSVSDTKKRQPGRVWRRLLFWILGPLIALVIAAAAIAFHPPEQRLLALGQRAFATRTGLEVRFSDKSTLQLLPLPHVELRDVRIFRPSLSEEERAVRIVEAKRLAITFDPAALFRLKVVARRVELDQPTVSVSLADSRRVELAQRDKAGITPNLRAERVIIRDGVLNYGGDGPNPELRLGAINLELKNVSAQGVGRAVGTVRWREEKVEINGNVLRRGPGEPSKLVFSLSAPALKVTFDGTASAGIGGKAQGEAHVSTGAMTDLLAWFNISPRAHGLTGPGEIKGHVELQKGVVRWRDAEIKLPAATGKGAFDVAYGEERPRLTGKLAWESLDLDRAFALEAPAMALSVAPRSIGPSLELPDGFSELGAYIDGVGKPPAATLSARAAPAPKHSPLWTKILFDPAALKVFDADVDQSVASLKVKGFAFKDVQMTGRLQAGALDLKIDRAGLDVGHISGDVKVDGSTAVPQFAINLKGEKLGVRSVTAPLAYRSLLRGDGDVEVDLRGSGVTLEKAAPTLTGTAKLSIRKGQVVGLDLKSALTAWWQKWSFDPSRRTPFDRLDAQVRFADGVVKTIGAARMRSKDVEVDASGTASLLRLSLNQRVRLRLSPPPSWLPIPIRVSGSWYAPKISIDFGMFSAQPGYFGFGAAPRKEAVPPVLRAKIEEVLGDEARAKELPPELRSLLERLVRR